MIFSALINNITLIISLSILYSFIIRRWEQGSRTGRVISGFLFGAVAIVGMMNPLVISPGLIFDGRSIIIGVAGFIGGWVTAVIAALMAIIYRSWLGGPGGIMGVSVIASSAAIGIAYHYIRRRGSHVVAPLHLIGFGIIVHACMLAMTMTLPSGLRYEVLSNIALPVMLIYPLGTLLVCVVLLDLESRVRAENALRESEARFRAIFVQAAVGVAEIEISTGRFLTVNRCLCEMVGRTEEEMQATTFQAITHPDDLDRHVDKTALLTAGKIGCYDLEKRYIRKDGAIIWVNLTSSPLGKAGEAPTRNLIVVQDITERRQIEEELRTSEDRYRTLFTRANDGIFIMSTGGKLVDVNEALARMHGYTVQEMLRMSLKDFDTPESFQMMPERMRRLLDGEALTFEVEHYHKDGHVFPLEVSASLISSGGESSIQCIHRDITQRKQAEEALRESEEKYRTIIENIEDGYNEVDIKGNFTFFNESACKMLGYGREELLGMNNRQYADEENSRKIYEIYKQVYLTGKPAKNFEWQVTRKDGVRRDVEVSISLIRDREGHPTGFRGIVRDTTDRKRAEAEKRSLLERLQRSEKMEALGQLAGGVAHDLNNVLGILSGYSELLLEEIPAGHRSRGHVEKILQSTEKGAAIIQDLLTLARRSVTTSEVINLNGVVADFLRTPVFEKMKDYHPRVTFRMEYDKNLLNIKGSPVHLEKTLINLVSNAAESISEAGEVTIRTESRYLDKPVRGYDEIKEGDYAVLTVSDTGTGIPAENREKIFEPFYTKKAMGRSGTGLGLSIVWGTVKDHQGYIDVQTEVGEGTTFTLYFPATREELIAPKQKEPIEQFMGRGESVLVVDDIAEQRDIAARLLTRLGYEVQAVSSGEGAVEYLREHTADILVLDMIMAPGIDGLETYRRVSAISQKQKAILVSGFSETDRVREAQMLGAGAYVKKPYVMEQIGVAIRNELDR